MRNKKGLVWRATSVMYKLDDKIVQDARKTSTI